MSAIRWFDVIISYSHSFAFIRTLKTAGTSLEFSMAEALVGPEDVIAPTTDPAFGTINGQNHLIPFRSYTPRMALGALARRKRQAFWQHCPAKRVIQIIGWDAWRSLHSFTIERNPFDRIVSRYWWDTARDDPRPSLSDWLHRQPERLLVNWPLYTVDDEIVVDRVLRYESLDSDLEELSAELGVSISMPEARGKAHHRADHRSYQEVLGPGDRALIERVCAPEIEALGYAWD